MKSLYRILLISLISTAGSIAYAAGANIKSEIKPQIPEEFENTAPRLRTRAFGENNIVGMTADHQTFAIVCRYITDSIGRRISAADLVFPSETGELTIDAEYSYRISQVEAGSLYRKSKKSNYAPLSPSAVTQ